MRAHIRFVLIATALGAACLLLPQRSSAYVASGFTWPHTPVQYVINTDNMDGLAAAAVINAVRTGADAWSQQSGAAFSFAYAGSTTQTVNTNDGINVVLFRNQSNGSAIATTYTWMSGSSIIDADLVFWDGGFTFFTGASGCSNGFYIEDIATHEFGHALGLGHSTTPGATMYPSTGPCNTNLRSLDADDISGVLALYPPEQKPPAPTGLHFVIK